MSLMQIGRWVAENVMNRGALAAPFLLLADVLRAVAKGAFHVPCSLKLFPAGSSHFSKLVD